MTDNRQLSEIYEEAGNAWADADAAADLLEQCKSSFLAEKILNYPQDAHNKAEAKVKASPEWKRYIDDMVNARKLANRLKIKLETIRMRFGEWQSDEANNRAQARL